MGSPSLAGTSRVAILLLVAVAALAGCATGRSARSGKGRPAAGASTDRSGPPVTLAWLPVEGFVFPEVATALDRELETVPIAGVAVRARAPVSMEVAQLSLECIAAEPRCYGLVGQQLQANRLLWAELSAPGKGTAFRASVILFDVDRAAEVQRIEREFPDPAAAIAGFPALVAQAVATPVEGVARAPVAAPP